MWRALADREARFASTVLASGLVAVMLNLIIPREVLQVEEDGEEEAEPVVEDVDVEALDQAQKAWIERDASGQYIFFFLIQIPSEVTLTQSTTEQATLDDREGPQNGRWAFLN
jgi:hypothetical protein